MTNTIKLINCNKKTLELILQGDKILSKQMDLTVPEKWTEFGDSIFQYTLEKVKNNPELAKWWTYLPIFKETNTLIGSCGFKGQPNKVGMVELGYEVAEGFRNKGYATEITGLLIKFAFNYKHITTIQAHTLAEKNASVRVLEKCNFIFIEEKEDSQASKIWKWELKKADFKSDIAFYDVKRQIIKKNR